jgi:hypothetical protein
LQKTVAAIVSGKQPFAIIANGKIESLKIKSYNIVPIWQESDANEISIILDSKKKYNPYLEFGIDNNTNIDAMIELLNYLDAPAIISRAKSFKKKIIWLAEQKIYWPIFNINLETLKGILKKYNTKWLKESEAIYNVFVTDPMNLLTLMGRPPRNVRQTLLNNSTPEQTLHMLVDIPKINKKIRRK